MKISKIHIISWGLIILFVFTSSCGGNKGKEEKTKSISVVDIIQPVNNESDIALSAEDLDKTISIVDVIESINNENGVILSTKDLDVLDYVSSRELPFKRINNEGNIIGYEYFISKLPAINNHTVLLVCDDNFDYPIYKISVLQNGNIYDKESLSITPHWAQPNNEEDFYTKKYFEIYEDYTIRIDTEEAVDGVVSKFTKYYRISDDGEFYEIEKE
jgi:hypothetical protein